MLLYNTRTRRTRSIPSFVLIVCRSRSRSSLFETGCFFWLYHLVSVTSVKMLVHDLQSHYQYISCVAGHTFYITTNTVYVKVANLHLSPILSWKIVFFTILCQPTCPLRAFFLRRAEFQKSSIDKTKPNFSFSHDQLRFIYTELKRFFL